jgi:DNA-binding CsgD family transcriptional regulator
LSLSMRVLTIALVLTLWVATGSFVLAAISPGSDPLRRLAVGGVFVLAAALALWRRGGVCRALRAHPGLILAVAVVSLGVALVDGVDGPYVPVTETVIGIATVVAGPRLVWLCVVNLEAGYGLAVLASRSPGALGGVLGAMLAYPFVALVVVGLTNLYKRFLGRVDETLTAFRAGAPALTPALTSAVALGAVRPVAGLPAPSSPLSCLSKAERGVVDELVAGVRPKQVALAWGVSLATVRKTHPPREAQERRANAARARSDRRAKRPVTARGRPVTTGETINMSASRARNHDQDGVDLVRCGAELVALSERFYLWVFVVALAFVAISTFAALVFLPLRPSPAGRSLLPAAAAALVVLALTGLAIRRARDVYLVLRRRAGLELVGVVVSALLMSVASPLRNELWWSAGSILAVIAVIAPLPRALLYCLVVLGANLAAHLAAGDLRETPTVGILGLWIALPFWTAMAAVIPARMAAHLMCLNATRRPARRPALRVNAWITTPEPRPRGTKRAPRPRDVGSTPASASTDTAPRAGSDGSPRMSRLTARQLQVVALLADGHRYRAIAECLSISPNQVHRHVRNAVERLRVRSPAELVAVAIAEGILPTPPPAGAAGPGDSPGVSSTAGRYGALTVALPA